MEIDYTKALAKGIVKLIFDLPIAILVMRAWVWGGIFEWLELPTPTLRQSVGIAVLILTIT